MQDIPEEKMDAKTELLTAVHSMAMAIDNIAKLSRSQRKDMIAVEDLEMWFYLKGVSLKVHCIGDDKCVPLDKELIITLRTAQPEDNSQQYTSAFFYAGQLLVMSETIFETRL
jgi:hypothetical protein